MIVGQAEIVVVARTAGFAKEVREQTLPALSGVSKDAKLAGEEAGANLRGGVRKETSKLAGDLEKDGAKGGEGLHRGMSGGLSKLASAIGMAGLPLGGLSSKLDQAGKSAEHAGARSSGLVGGLDSLGATSLKVGAALGAGVVAAAIDVGEKMQSAEASIASASGTTVAAADKIGQALYSTAGKSEFSAVAMAQAFAGVAGQLEATQGRALNAKEALDFQSAAADLAAAKQIDLGSATRATAGIMQTFQLRAQDAAHVTDVLYGASRATGQSIDGLASQLQRAHSKLGDTAGSIGDLAGLLVDMTNQGITGRAAMAALNASMNTLQKTATGVTVATQAQKTAFDQMSPSLQALAGRYEKGEISSKAFSKQTGALSPQQAQLAAEVVKATKAVDQAQLKYKEMGVQAFNAHGQFVGMRDIIDQLHPRFAQMTQQQQLAAASTLFGAGAARQMIAVIDAGPAAYDKATTAVNRHGAAQDAAAKQASTLHGEERTLAAEVSDLAGRIGTVLIPMVTAMIAWFVKATTFVTEHKAVLIALAAVVTGILGPAIAVFAINKMAAFSKSFVDAAGHVKEFASGVQSAVSKVIAAFTKQDAAADASATKIQQGAQKGAGAAQSAAGDVEGAAGRVEGANATAAGSFAGEATAASVAAGDVDASVGSEAAAVSSADTAIEGENAAAGASFAAVGAGAKAALAALAPLLGALGVVAADGAKAALAALAPLLGALGVVAAGTAVGNATVRAVGGHNKPEGSTGAAGGVPGTPSPGATILGIHIGGPGGALLHGLGLGAQGGLVTQPTLAVLGEAGQELVIPVDMVRSIAGATPLGGVSPAAPASAGSLPGFSAAQSAVAAQLFQIFTGAGLSKAGAAGLIGNFAQESSLNPGEPGGYLAQWGGSRLTGEQAFAAQRGLSPTSVSAQAGFVLQELAGYGPLLRELRSSASPAQAALDISNQYERPATWAANNPNREAQAAAALRAFGGLATGGAAPGASAPSTPQATMLEIAKQRAQLANEIAAEKAAVTRQEASIRASVSGKGASPEAKQRAAIEIADLKAALQIQVAAQKAALGEQSAAEKAQSAKRTTDLKAANSELATMLAAIHSANMKTLQTLLDHTHAQALQRTERALDHDHSAALSELSRRLVAVHAQAFAKLGAEQKAAAEKAAAAQAASAAAAATAAAQAADGAEAAAINQASQIAADQAKRSADQIADSTKIYLDQQAATGLQGAALTAAGAQTALDQVAAASNQTIDSAQLGVDQATGGSLIAQAQAAALLAQAQASAQIQQAQAQSVLDKANAAANTVSQTPAPVAAPAAPATFNFTIYGAGMSASQLMSEIGWAVKTGALPVAAPA